MARFPVINSEDLVQANDKLRLDATASFVSGEAVFTAVEVKPTKLASYINIFSADPSRWFLDWAYPFEIVVDPNNDSIDFEDGAGLALATITTGSYTLAALAAEIATQLTAAGGQVYACTVSGDKFTISAPGVFSLYLATGVNVATALFPHIGFTGANKTGTITYTGSQVETVEAEVSVRVTNGAGNTVKTKTIQVISAEADYLFSDDNQLKAHEYDILKLLPPGKATHLYAHRRAQTQIMDWLDKEGYVDVNRVKFTKAAIVDLTEVSEWSVFTTLRLIYESVSNAVDDIFAVKADKYGKLETYWRDRAVLRLDIDGDGDADIGEEIDIRSTFCARR